MKQHLNHNPDLPGIFQQKVSETILVAPDLNACLEQAWQQAKASVPENLHTNPKTPTSSASAIPPSSVTLKEYWQCKQQLRQAQTGCQTFCAPLLWMISVASPAHIWQHHLPAARRCVAKLFRLWRAGVRFDECNRQLRKRTRERKIAQVDQLIAETTQASKQGYSGLHQLINRLRPKTYKRSTHFRHPSGELMTPQEELRHLADFFKDLYASDHGSPEQWTLRRALRFTTDEVRRALRAMPSSKALPRHQVPAILWRHAEDSLVPALCDTFNQLLQPGPLCLPDRILTSYLVLLAKPGKPPTKPSNLRPINLLPAEAKILARIAVERLRPLLAAKLESIPQFAYTGGRQTGDAIDRVMAHCQRVRSALKSHQHNIFDKRTGKQRQPFVGGLQLSLDLKQAFDRIPRQQLLSSLEQLDIPSDLTSLILYIHDYARVVIERPVGEESVCMRRGIRQGCGLAPLLWLAYTIVIHNKLAAYIPVDSLTEYADDLHVQWEFAHPRDFRRACTQIPKILHDLESLGMLVSIDKTAVLLAMKGAASQHLLRDFTVRRGGERFLLLPSPFGKVRLPIRTHHTYLGIKIGYTTFERATMQLRASQAWTAFHRLHPFLKNPTIPLNKRLHLWTSGVWPVLSYGLSSVGVDHVCANQLNQLVLKQLRMVARSPPHITRETNHNLLDRLGLTPPMQMLQRLCQARNDTGRRVVSHLQPAHVQQWWSLVTITFQQPAHQLEGSDTQVRAALTEVTQIQRFQCSCPTCGQSFPSTHALSVHIGKMHPDSRPPKPRRTRDKNTRVEAHRQHAKDGLPQCVHCGKRFYGWPQFMGHFNQQACPVLFLQALGDSSPQIPKSGSQAPNSSQARPAQGAHAPGSQLNLTNASPTTADARPVFHRPELQELAKTGDIHRLAEMVRQIDRLHYCPQCNQWIANVSYIARHACKMHPALKQAQPFINQWIKQRGRLSSPCEWCLQRYDRASAHIQACVVLWTCAHMLYTQGQLVDPKQITLQDVFGRQLARGGQGRAEPLFSLHAAGKPTHHGPTLDGGQQGLGGARAGAHGSGQVQAGPGATGHDPAREVCQGQREGPAAGGDGGVRGQASLGLGGGPAQQHRQRQPPGLPGQTGSTDQTGRPGQARRPVGGLGPKLVQARLGTPAGEEQGQARRPTRARGRTPRTGQALRQTSAPSGGLVGNPESGYHLRSLPEDGGERVQLVHNLGSLQGSPGMASYEGIQPGQLGSADEVSANALPFGCPLEKLKKLDSSPDLLAKAKKLGLVEGDTYPVYPFLQWNPKEKRLVKAQQEPLSHVEALQTVTLLSQLNAMPDVVGRFHAMRRLSEQHQAEVIPFVLQVQNRNAESQQFYQGMRRLCRCSVMHLIGAAMRPSRLGRSPLAIQIEKILRDL